MVPAERAPAHPEILPRRFNRQQLLSSLTGRATELRQNLVFNRPDLIPYAGILSLATELSSFDDIGPAEHRHLRRMASLEARRLPRTSKNAGDTRFWETVQASAGTEWTKAQAFAKDLNDIPKSWHPARDDLLLLGQYLDSKAKN
ncbi:hypothetical protein H0X09_00655 [Candidatus Saccharibacteria bacterium]|nr:hypothetical protein [Candidatus Saccharibacteria bacterium]